MRAINVGDIDTKVIRSLTGNRCMSVGGLTISDSVTQTATVTLAGTFDVGDTYTITINGTAYTYTVLAGATNIDGIATALASLVDANAAVAASATGAVITVTASVATVAFTISASCTNDAAGTDDQGIAVAVTQQIATVTIGGTFEATDVYTITLDGTPFSHTVVGGDTNNDGIATALAALINGATYTAGAVGSVVTITKAGSFTCTAAGVDHGGTADETAVVAFTSQTATITLTGTVDIGDVFSVTIDGTACPYTVLAADTTLTAIAAKLELLTEAVTNIASTSTLGVVTVVKTGAGDNRMTITSSATNDAAGTSDQTATVANTVNSVKEVETDNAIAFTIDGQLYASAAVTAIAVAGYSRVLPVSSHRWYTVQINAAGTVTTVAGEDDADWLPEVSSGNTIIGSFKVVTDSTHTFTPTITALNAAGITTTYFDLSCVPKLGYPA